MDNTPNACRRKSLILQKIKHCMGYKGFCLRLCAIFLIIISLNLVNSLNNSKKMVTIDGESDFSYYFCPQDNCDAVLINHIKSCPSQLFCAFYDISDPNIITAFQKTKAKVSIITEKSTNLPEGLEQYKINERNTKRGIMHSKFCICDKKNVFFGSYNPTIRGARENKNMVMLTNAPSIMSLFNEEFDEYQANIFGEGEKTKEHQIKIKNATFSLNFCPEDNCKNRLLNELKEAKHSIFFLTFSFTDYSIARELIHSHNEKINVKGIFEARQENKWSVYTYLLNNNVSVILDNSPSTMHHKMFIIDNHTVFFGTYNPTRNGASYNDEFIVIIKDNVFSGQCVNEFNVLFETATNKTGNN